MSNPAAPSSEVSSELLNVATTTHGRLLLRRASGAARGFAIGFHGYAENADIHLRELVAIPGIGEWHVASVQALHPFYRGRSEEVVSSWMTRLDRELAIADNISYVRAIVDRLRGELGERPVVFIGFSQGAGMAWRAAASIPCSGVITLGGDVPPDVIARPDVSLPPAFIGRGRGDDWYTAEKLEHDVASLPPATPVTTITFDGGHEWTETFRGEAGRFLQAIGAG